MVATKNTLKIFRAIIHITIGIFQFVLTRQNSARTQIAMIFLFCKRGGRSNDFLSGFFGYRAKKTSPISGLLGTLDEVRLKEITEHLDENGYFVFETSLPNSLCDAILSHSLSVEGSSRQMSSQTGKDWAARITRFKRDRPDAVRFEYEPEQTVASPTVQRILCDPSILAVAEAYLRSRPILDIVHLWWHTAFSNQPDENAAQFYHFDMDRLKWLKFFFYITDVTPESGPHSFVASSHRTGGIPKTLLKKGYARLKDSEVENVFPKDKLKEFVGPRGLILAEDTRGLHKGKHVTKGDRLIFQLEYTVSLFGAPYRKIKMPSNRVSELDQAIRERPELFQAFEIN